MWVATGCVAVRQETRPADSPPALGPTAYSSLDIDFLPIRVGVEYLPPDENPTIAQPSSGSRLNLGSRSEPTMKSESVREHTPVGAGRPSERSLASQRNIAWDLDDARMRAIKDPFERTTMMFVEDIMGEDRRRLQREFGTPILTTRSDMNWTLQTHMDEREREYTEKYVNHVARRLVRKPLQRAIRRGTVLNDFEMALEDFKRGNIPLSAEYQERAKNRHGFGRVSMSVRLRGDDPVKISYRNWGFRIRTGKHELTASYKYRLTKYLDAGLWMKYGYETHDNIFRADMHYEIDLRTHFYMVIGNHMEFLSGPTAYSLLDSAIDGEHGVLFYIQHQF